MGWKRTVGLAAGLSLLAVWSVYGGNAKPRASGSELAVEIDDGYLIVAPGNVGELRGLRFLLDTGASTTVIDRRVAKKLGMVGGETKVVNFDKTVQAKWGTVASISFGAEQAADVRVLIEDLRYLRTSGAWVDGVIGLDLLRRKSFLVDYARKVVVFGATESGGMRAAPLRAGETEVCVEAELGGRKVWMIADTGLWGTVLYERGGSPRLADYRRGAQGEARSLSGSLKSMQGVVSEFKLGGQDLERQVLLVDAPDVKMLADVAGYWGPASLGAKQIFFDFAGKELRWRK